MTKKICAYCKDSRFENKLSERIKESIFIALGYDISHGACEKCAKNYFS